MRKCLLVAVMSALASTAVAGTQWILGETAGSDRTFTISSDGMPTYQSAVIGYYGTGRLYHTKSTFNLGVLAMGYSTGSYGNYELSGQGNLTTVAEGIGYGGNAQFNQTGGTHTVSAGIILGHSDSTPNTTGGNGSYLLSGGVLNVPVIEINRDSSFSMTGGTLNIENLGLTNKFNIHLSGPGTIRVYDSLSFAPNTSIHLGTAGTLKLQSSKFNSNMLGTSILGTGQLVTSTENGFTTVSVIPEPATLFLTGIAFLAIRWRECAKN